MIDIIVLLVALALVTIGAHWIARRPGLYCALDGHAPRKLDDGSVVCARCAMPLSPAPTGPPASAARTFYYCEDCRGVMSLRQGRCSLCGSRSFEPIGETVRIAR
jgi:hypothetical protein